MEKYFTAIFNFLYKDIIFKGNVYFSQAMCCMLLSSLFDHVIMNYSLVVSSLAEYISISLQLFYNYSEKYQIIIGVGY